ncbi:MAG: response regulator transcription factor [Ruminococcus sp.]|jgi:two-component system response regulator YesN
MCKILIIEDEEIEQRAFQKFISQFFPEVKLLEGARNGIDGLLTVEEENPDLLLLDIQMPDMDGLTLLKKIREKGYRGKIIIQTAYDYFDYVQTALNQGADAYILKPAADDVMCDTISRCLKALSLEQSSERERQTEKEQLNDMREYIVRETAKKIQIRNMSQMFTEGKISEHGSRIIKEIAESFLKCIKSTDLKTGQRQIMESWSVFWHEVKRMNDSDLPDSIWKADMEEIQSKMTREELLHWLEWKIETALLQILNRKEDTYHIFLRQAMSYIKAHYREDISLQQIADEVGISSYYLSHLFSEQVGKSITNYILDLRIQHMFQMLEKEDLTIKELAGELGYRDVAYFSRVVKKSTGKTVGEIKRQIRKSK